MLTKVGKLLREMRLNNDEILREMATKLGVTSAFLSAVENGIVNLYAQLRNIVVTFNPNGGTIPIGQDWDGSGNTASKHLNTSIYGILPTPTREGYTFLGWNGKNMFNLDDFVEFYTPYQPQARKAEKVEFDGEEVWKIYGSVDVTGRSLHYMEDAFKANTQYHFSLDTYEVCTLNNGNYLGGLRIIVEYTDGTYQYANNITCSEQSSWKHVDYTSSRNKTISHIRVTYGMQNAYAYFKNFQLEEGASATEYEPYYVTSSVPVVQSRDHTLTAIWEEN